MRAGLLFLGIGTALLGFAAHGLLSEGVFAFGRHQRGLIIREIDPFLYAVTTAAYVFCGVLMTTLATLIFWAHRRQKEAERRFFRQRDTLQ